MTTLEETLLRLVTVEAVEAGARALALNAGWTEEPINAGLPDTPWLMDKYREEATIALAAAAPLIAAQELRDAANEESRIELIGKTPQGLITDSQRRNYWARKELSSTTWLRARAGKLRELAVSNSQKVA